MDEQTPPRRGSAAPVVAAILAACLVAAGVYITQLRGQLTATQKQLEPFADVAKKLYPDADQATALHSVSERLQTMVVRAPANPAAPAALADAIPPEETSFDNQLPSK